MPGFSNCSLESLKRLNDRCLYNVPTYKVFSVTNYAVIDFCTLCSLSIYKTIDFLYADMIEVVNTDRTQ